MDKKKLKIKNEAMNNYFRKVAVYVLFIGGAYLIFSSGSVITGAAVGVTAAASYKVFMGFIGLVLALALTKYKKTFDRDIEN